MQGFQQVDEAFHADPLKNRDEFLRHLDASLIKFREARVGARATALKWAAFVDYPSDLEVLRRIDVYMMTGTELIESFVDNVVNFHRGKPYLNQIHWERIFTPTKFTKGS